MGILLYMGYTILLTHLPNIWCNAGSWKVHLAYLSRGLWTKGTLKEQKKNNNIFICVCHYPAGGLFKGLIICCNEGICPQKPMFLYVLEGTMPFKWLVCKLYGRVAQCTLDDVRPRWIQSPLWVVLKNVNATEFLCHFDFGILKGPRV